MKRSILLIGPIGVGKSTIARLLANKLALPVIDVDASRWEYFNSFPGFEAATVSKLFESGRELQAFAYMKPFEALLVETLLGNEPEGIIDFGAGYTVYSDENLFEQVCRAFKRYAHVVLLSYSRNMGESLDALEGRHDLPAHLYRTLNKQFIESDCNPLLAKHTIYTKGKTPEQIMSIILNRTGLD